MKNNGDFCNWCIVLYINGFHLYEVCTYDNVWEALTPFYNEQNEKCFFIEGILYAMLILKYLYDNVFVNY